MNFAPPQWIKTAAEEALNEVATNHYSHPKGRIRLREALKAHYSPQLGRDLDVESEILITSGANEGESTSCALAVFWRSSGRILIVGGQDSIPYLLPSSNRAMRLLCSSPSSISTYLPLYSMAGSASMCLCTPLANPRRARQVMIGR